MAKQMVLDYETLTNGMEANQQSALRYALFLRDAIMRQRNEDKVQLMGVRIVEVCPGCGESIRMDGSLPLCEESTARNGNGPLWHVRCWNARQAEYARLEEEDA